MAITQAINKSLWLLKWPVALLSVSALPAILSALFWLLAKMSLSLDQSGLFVSGFLGYVILDRLLFSRHFMGSSFSTFEHELTHALFAWLTWHRVTKLKVTWRSGGMVEIIGGGNWLISIAPYWFPTLCLPVIFLAELGLDRAWWCPASLGLTCAYHLVSTWRETHKGQRDLQETGFVFAWLFLPSANLVTFGLIFAFAHAGLEGSSELLNELWRAYQGSVSALLGDPL